MSRGKPVLSKHMRKAIDRLEILSGTVNLALQVVDARAPKATECGIMTRVLRGAHLITVFTKSDLADPAATDAWMKWYAAKGKKAVLFHYGKQKSRKNFIHSIMDDFRKTISSGDQVKAVVVGLPNVGKSTVMNMLTGGKQAKVGAMPGITRGVQLINVDNEFLIIDTPGVVSSAFSTDLDRQKTLALVGCLQDKFFEPSDAVAHLLEMCLPDYASLFREVYDLEREPEDVESFYEVFARRRGLLVKGGGLDIERVSPIVLRDFATGRLSGITLEKSPLLPDAAKDSPDKK